MTGKEIRALRERLRLTQRELADLLLLDHDTVGRMERGGGCPTRTSATSTLLRALARAIDEHPTRAPEEMRRALSLSQEHRMFAVLVLGFGFGAGA